MTVSLFVNEMVGIFSLLSLWFLYSFAYRDYRRDVYRQRLFEVRNALFDMAGKGEISFNEPAYQTLRTTINGFIRFAHRMQFGEFVVFIALEETAREPSPDLFTERWQAQTASLPRDLTQKLDALRVRVHMLALEELVLTSPLLLALLLPPLMIVVMKSLSQQIWIRPYTWCRALIRNRWISAMDSAALEEGSFALG